MMRLVENYLEKLQEQFSTSVAKADINGQFQDEWTSCYKSKCLTANEEDKFVIRFCKTKCIIAAANKAIARLNSQKSNCAQVVDPRRCLKSLQSTIERFKQKIEQTRKMQDTVSAKQAAFRRGTGA